MPEQFLPAETRPSSHAGQIPEETTPHPDKLAGLVAEKPVHLVKYAMVRPNAANAAYLNVGSAVIGKDLVARASVNATCSSVSVSLRSARRASALTCSGIAICHNQAWIRSRRGATQLPVAGVRDGPRAAAPKRVIAGPWLS
ncbi:hypothetical protein [Rhizobium favelukesii]|nr:hypothetical protein [Rhizobium favelukesii]MCS0460658.1 hypothetical protein [Rhizobium favelukesii]